MSFTERAKRQNILVAVYICDSALNPFKKLNIRPIFFGIDIGDLNPSLESMKKLAVKYHVRALLCASMNANPENLINVEKYSIAKDFLWLIMRRKALVQR